jgi:hypothetical protein
MPGKEPSNASATAAPATAERSHDTTRHPRGAGTHGRMLAVAVLLMLTAACTALAGAAAPAAAAAERPFLSSIAKVRTIGTTVPANGDENPYGIVNVTQSSGALVAGDVLVSNFNDSANDQGTGTTIVQLAPNGRQSLFAQLSTATLPGACPGGIGLTTALALLPQGYVVVGSLPTEAGNVETAGAGCLIVLNSSGQPVETISGAPINGPWDMTSVSEGDAATLFVTNVLNGTVASGETPTDEGTVARLHIRVGAKRPPKVTSETVIAEGFPEVTNPEALVLGPTGVALAGNGTLYVADTQGNRIAAVPNALTRHAALGGGGTTIASGGLLNSPLGMTLAPNGDILTANAGDGYIVETTPAGTESARFETGAGAGGLFGLVLTPGLKGIYFVDDAENTLDLAH